MLDSRIPRPPGGHFIQLHAWAINAVGRAAAIVLGEADFLDRAKELPGQPIFTRTRIVAELEGFLGEKSVDEALSVLVALGWLVRHTIRTVGPKNLQTHHEYSLNAVAVSEYLEGGAVPGVANMRSRESQKCAQKCDSSNMGIEEEMQQQCSGIIAAPMQAAAYAVKPESAQQKRRRARPSGIVTFYGDDVAEAARLEQSNSAEEIAAAVSAVRGTGKEPVPGLVQAAISRHQSKAARDASQREKLNALDAVPPATPEKAAAGLARAKAALRHGQPHTTI